MRKWIVPVALLAVLTPFGLAADKADKKDEKPKNTIDEQLNKALEVLKNRESKG